MPFPRFPGFVLTALLVLLPSVSSATGVGFYLEYGNVFDAELDSDFGDIEYEEDHYGVGLSVDTNVAGDQLFNYRLNLGYQHVEGEYGGFNDDGDGFIIDNTFGFGIIRNDRVRFWVGPAVRLSFDFFESDTFDFGIGAGPAIGVNIHTGSLVSIGLTTGYQIAYSVSVPDGAGDNVDGYEQMAFFRLDVLFRVGGEAS